MATPTVPSTYRAYVYEQYGAPLEQLQIKTIPTPTLPALRVRIKVHSAALNPVDHKLVDIWGDMLTAAKPSPENPYRVGFDVAGTVVEVGAGVHASRLRVGDEVFGMTAFDTRGTLAEYVEMDQQYVAKKPKNLDFDQAASAPLVALTSYQALYHYAKLQPNQRVLILGASGATGLYAVQLAKARGAHVTATGSHANAELLKSLGADVVLDYRTQKWGDLVDKHSIDVIYDCGVEPNSWNGPAQDVLKKQTGQYVTLLGVTDPIPAKYGAINHNFILVYPSSIELAEIAAMFEKEQLKPVVDCVVPFDMALDGFKRVLSQRAVGKVVVKVL